MPAEARERLLSPGEAARMLGLSEFMLRYYERTGRLNPVLRVGPQGMRLFKLVDVERLAAARQRRRSNKPAR